MPRIARIPRIARLPRLLLSLLLSLAAQPSPAPAQQPAPSQQPAPDAPPPFTLRTESRIVLLDVTATDDAGRPVSGLPQSAFHITDAKHPQTISSFEEHTPENTPVPLPAAAPARPRGSYSNDFLLHAPAVLNILLLDISNLGIQDQMFLNVELRHLLDTLAPADPASAQPLAVYLRSSGTVVLLQDFTTDRDLLRTAVRRGLPRLFQPNPYLDDLDTLHQIARGVAQLPGRKNLLWFSGGVRVRSDIPTLISQPMLSRDNDIVRQTYDELEAARIAVYPIDARGLTITSSPALSIQHSLMNEVADATGGRALYNTNGLALSAARVIADDRSFYTLTYVPSPYRADRHWHPVHLTVDRPSVHLSYREGYFSDKPLDRPTPDRPSTHETPTRLLADGSFARDPNASSPASEAPIVFNAVVLPTSDPAASHAPPAELTRAAVAHHGSVPYSIRFTVPADAFPVKMVDGKPLMVVGLAAIAFNLNGTDVGHVAQQLTLAFDPARLPFPRGARIPVTQQLALDRGNLTLYLAVWNPDSGRSGNLEIPLTIETAKH